VDDKRGVRSAYFRVHFAKPRGHVGIEPSNKGIRAEPPSQAEPMPAMETLNMNAKGATIQPTPTRPAMWLTACTIPWRRDVTLADGDRSVSVAPT